MRGRGAAAQPGGQQLGQGDGSDDVHLVDLAQDVEGVVGQAGLGAGAEHAGVVDQQIAPPGPLHGAAQRGPMGRVGHVPGDGFQRRPGGQKGS